MENENKGGTGVKVARCNVLSCQPAARGDRRTLHPGNPFLPTRVRQQAAALTGVACRDLRRPRAWSPREELYHEAPLEADPITTDSSEVAPYPRGKVPVPQMPARSKALSSNDFDGAGNA